MQLGNLFKKAKVVYDKRGGSAAAKGDLQNSRTSRPATARRPTSSSAPPRL